jgi:tRNA/tmRNA/rRNA uracil-C5-methylase (TrmA/RlmC/RlmD family)
VSAPAPESRLLSSLLGPGSQLTLAFSKSAPALAPAPLDSVQILIKSSNDALALVPELSKAYAAKDTNTINQIALQVNTLDKTAEVEAKKLAAKITENEQQIGKVQVASMAMDAVQEMVADAKQNVIYGKTTITDQTEKIKEAQDIYYGTVNAIDPRPPAPPQLTINTGSRF